VGGGGGRLLSSEAKEKIQKGPSDWMALLLWVMVWLNFYFPSLFVGAIPEFHGFGVVEYVARFGVDGEFVFGEVGDVG